MSKTKSIDRSSLSRMTSSLSPAIEQLQALEGVYRDMLYEAAIAAAGGPESISEYRDSLSEQRANFDWALDTYDSQSQKMDLTLEQLSKSSLEMTRLRSKKIEMDRSLEHLKKYKTKLETSVVKNSEKLEETGKKVESLSRDIDALPRVRHLLKEAESSPLAMLEVMSELDELDPYGFLRLRASTLDMYDRKIEKTLNNASEHYMHPLYDLAELDVLRKQKSNYEEKPKDQLNFFKSHKNKGETRLKNAKEELVKTEEHIKETEEKLVLVNADVESKISSSPYVSLPKETLHEVVNSSWAVYEDFVKKLAERVSTAHYVVPENLDSSVPRLAEQLTSLMLKFDEADQKTLEKMYEKVREDAKEDLKKKDPNAGAKLVALKLAEDLLRGTEIRYADLERKLRRRKNSELLMKVLVEKNGGLVRSYIDSVMQLQESLGGSVSSQAIKYYIDMLAESDVVESFGYGDDERIRIVPDKGEKFISHYISSSERPALSPVEGYKDLYSFSGQLVRLLSVALGGDKEKVKELRNTLKDTRPKDSSDISASVDTAITLCDDVLKRIEESKKMDEYASDERCQSLIIAIERSREELANAMVALTLNSMEPDTFYHPDNTPLLDRFDTWSINDPKVGTAIIARGFLNEIGRLRYAPLIANMDNPVYRGFVGSLYAKMEFDRKWRARFNKSPRSEDANLVSAKALPDAIVKFDKGSGLESDVEKAKQLIKSYERRGSIIGLGPQTEFFGISNDMKPMLEKTYGRMYFKNSKRTERSFERFIISDEFVRLFEGAAHPDYSKRALSQVARAIAADSEEYQEKIEDAKEELRIMRKRPGFSEVAIKTQEEYISYLESQNPFKSFLFDPLTKEQIINFTNIGIVNYDSHPFDYLLLDDISRHRSVGVRDVSRINALREEEQNKRLTYLRNIGLVMKDYSSSKKGEDEQRWHVTEAGMKLLEKSDIYFENMEGKSMRELSVALPLINSSEPLDELATKYVAGMLREDLQRVHPPQRKRSRRGKVEQPAEEQSAETQNINDQNPPAP